jgi:hypothetical protein
VAGTAFAAHARSLGYGLLGWDDVPYVLEAPHLALDLPTVRWAFGSIHVAYWLPLTWLSYALDATLWGLDGPGFHLTNVLLHSMNAVLVGALAARLLRRRAGDTEPWRARDVAAAMVAGTLWSVHPLRVESVAWIAERKDVLSGLFILLALHAWISWAAPSAAPRRRATYVAAVGAAALATLAKGTAVVLPALLLILDWYPLGRLDRLRRLPALLAEKLPFLVIAIVGAVMTLIAQREAMWSVPPPATTRVFVAAKALAVYLLRTVWPVGLSPYYPHPGPLPLASPAYLAAVGAVALISAAAWRAREREPGWLALWGWYVVAALPTLGLVQVGLQETADRHTYLPGIVPALLAGAVASGVVERARRDGRFARRCLLAVSSGAVALSVAWGAAAWRQTGFWVDDLAVWARVLEIDPDIGVAHFYRAKVLADEGALEAAVREIDASITIAERKAYGRRGSLYSWRAQLLERMGRSGEALVDRVRANSLQPP